MKTNTLCSLLGAAALLPLGFWARGHENSFVAHEWGTFTSVQGGDGVLLDWRPLESSVLPKFVYDWKHPGLDRGTASQNPFSKRWMLTLQRMETPVIYFYAGKRQTVDVSVDFPQGVITEWYPQAAQIGPAFVRGSTPFAGGAEVTLAKSRQQPEIPPTCPVQSAALTESRAHWAEVEILPPNENRFLAKSLPFDRSGSHYFAARDTDSAYLRVNSLAAADHADEHEKFIFYRGTGSFPTPLRVTMATGNAVTVSNTGVGPLVHLFVLGLQNRAGKFVHIDRLAPGEQRTVLMDSAKSAVALDSLSRQLGKAMASALSSQGLYAREATAMVDTWKDSWFAEDGLRVLYVLPRAWTDRTLPLTIKPAPRELVRVMVGRAEVLTPSLEQKITVALDKAKAGDNAAREQVVTELKRLGRFAEPALRLATAKSDPKISEIAWQLFQTAAKPGTEPL